VIQPAWLQSSVQQQLRMKSHPEPEPEPAAAAAAKLVLSGPSLFASFQLW